MASQAAIFANTISGMKKAVKRKPYDSDSDSSIDHLTNRGNKLKRKSRFVHEGQLASPTGPQVYRKKVEHAGYYRDIISTNPPVNNEDGYEVDSDDEEAQLAIAAAAEFDPYSDVKIEQLLMPLTAASELPAHPTLSKPFLSKTLTELTQNAGAMVQKEKASLWRIKHLLTRLSGDNSWIPCDCVEDSDDVDLFFDEKEKPQGSIIENPHTKDDADHASTGTLASEDAEPSGLLDVVAEATKTVLDTVKSGTDSNTVEELSTNNIARNGDIKSIETKGSADSSKRIIRIDEGESKGIEQNTELERSEVKHSKAMEVEVQVAVKEATAQIEESDMPAGEEIDIEIEGEVEDFEDTPAPRRMRTRAQAQAASENTASSRARSISPEFSNEALIHPYFLAAAKSHPDRNLSLPQNEAEETRRLLQLYIQKQEEVCRGAQRIYEGLLRADRYRKLVMKWSKAEAHCGPNRDMSDGEDWYDKEEWNLDEDLKKGQDEEEEDAATTAKKTRTRRQ